jgi:death-on-curing family protein
MSRHACESSHRALPSKWPYPATVCLVSKVSFRVRTLAREAGLPAEDAALVLMEAGLQGIRDGDSYVAGRDALLQARAALRAHNALLAATAMTVPPQRSATKRFMWPTLDRDEVLYLATDEVRSIHQCLTDEFAGTEDAIWPAGVKDEGLLESAVNRPLMAEEKYPNVAAAAAALTHALIQNHPFHNGNKRTALITLVVFLQKNSWYPLFDEDDIYSLVVSVADHSIAEPIDGRSDSDREVFEIYRWVREKSISPKVGDPRLRWRELDPILRHFGCEMRVVPGNKREIRRGRLRVAPHYRNSAEELSGYQLSYIRKGLELDAEHRVDSRVFYNRGKAYPEVGDAIERYRGVLKRLALLDRT